MQTERDRHLNYSGRIELRPHERADFPLYEEWYAATDIWNLSSWRAHPMKPAETRELFEGRQNSATDISFAIHLKESESSTVVIGTIGLMNINDVASSGDLSIIIGRPEHRGSGYGPEAIALMLDHGFEKAGLDKISLSVFDFNSAAIRTYRRLGFVYDGKIQNAVTREDGSHDAILMALTADMWRRRRL
ncbi:GNAT family N-acetyltransferase [Rubrobacter indicoceani]|uniref:GNAT family N-acetyltransferase n=1 Tax=Rubrobacter indicoceani TaxID=2051957 RepID=UPI0013C4ED1C|nr:GNAT family protein [Rubrobacter indicoceani]